MKRISDLRGEEIRVGMRLWNVSHDKLGTIVLILYPPADRYQSAWVRWDDGGMWALHSSFWENQCECEIFRMLDDDQCEAIKLWQQKLQEAPKRGAGLFAYADMTLPDFVFKMTGKQMQDVIHGFGPNEQRYVAWTACGQRIDWWDAVRQRLSPDVIEFQTDPPVHSFFLTDKREYMTCPDCKVKCA